MCVCVCVCVCVCLHENKNGGLAFFCIKLYADFGNEQIFFRLLNSIKVSYNV
jgi:hypothetical protein